MSSEPAVDWLLDCEPRAVQIEALSRSYYGVSSREQKDDTPNPSTLRHYPTPARAWAHFLDMRLGKTPTALNEAALLLRDGAIDRLLIVAPAKFRNTWAVEASRFGFPLPILPIAKASQRKAIAKLTSEHRALVVNYEAARTSALLGPLLSFVDERTMVVLDESIQIKSRRSANAVACQQLCDRAGYVRLLSGKPVVQGVDDLFSQLKALRQLEGKNYWSFLHTYAVMGGFRGKKVKGTKNKASLDRILEVCSFRAKRAHWGQFHDPDYVVDELNMVPAQQRVYDELEREFVAELDSGEIVSIDTILAKHAKLQQVPSGFVLDSGTVHEIVDFRDTNKFKSLHEYLDMLDSKAIVSALYTQSVKGLYSALQDLGMEPALIAGAATMRTFGADVDQEKDRFNKDPRCRVLVAQESAVKYGHTLIGTPEDPCSTIFFYENSYSLDDRSQTEVRNQVEGASGLTIVDFASCGQELAVIKALQQKESVSEAILSVYRDRLSNLSLFGH